MPHMTTHLPTTPHDLRSIYVSPLYPYGMKVMKEKDFPPALQRVANVRCGEDSAVRSRTIELMLREPNTRNMTVREAREVSKSFRE